MPFTLPTAVSAGSVLTASNYNQAVRSNAMFGMATFTNEAARDAALTSPEEGMMAYLTAPTVPAATGDVTAVPTGVITIYNGSVWVCTSEVSARTAAAGSVSSTSFTATLSGSPGTNPTVTLVTGTTALIMLTVSSNNSSANIGNLVGVAVSGATTLAASDALSVLYDVVSANYSLTQTLTHVITGLTAGTNTFAINYRVSGGTGVFQRRSLTVKGIA